LYRTLAFQLDSLVAGTGSALVDARLVVLADNAKANAIRSGFCLKSKLVCPCANEHSTTPKKQNKWRMMFPGGRIR
jgi:hypothetical protein